MISIEVKFGHERTLKQSENAALCVHVVDFQLSIQKRLNSQPEWSSDNSGITLQALHLATSPPFAHYDVRYVFFTYEELSSYGELFYGEYKENCDNKKKLLSSTKHYY